MSWEMLYWMEEREKRNKRFRKKYKDFDWDKWRKEIVEQEKKWKEEWGWVIKEDLTSKAEYPII